MILFVALLVLGCSGASWQSVEVDPEYRRPTNVAITVVGARLSREAADELADAIVHELGRHRIPARIVPESSGADDVRVTIVKWDPGDQFLRWLAFAGKGEIFVEVDSATLGVEGKARGYVTGGWFGGDDENSASAVGALIGRTIATGVVGRRDLARDR